MIDIPPMDAIDLRDYLAAKAMQALANSQLPSWAGVAADAYNAAEAMIAERAKRMAVKP